MRGESSIRNNTRTVSKLQHLRGIFRSIFPCLEVCLNLLPCRVLLPMPGRLQVHFRPGRVLRE